MLKRFITLNVFLLSILLISGCGKSEQNYWDEALKNQKEGKYAEAVASYETLVKEYPQSEKAVKSLFEAAKIYQQKVIKNLDQKQSLQKAIETYDKIFKEYFNSPEAHKALFMKAFIQANELQDYDAAKQTYQLFLQKFPNDEMTPSAKAELETIGLAPEEILKRNSQASK